MGTITRTTANNLTTNQGEGVMVKLQTATISSGTSVVNLLLKLIVHILIIVGSL